MASAIKLISINFTTEEIARFHRTVFTNGPEECWPWRGSIGDHGYGRFFVERQNSTVKLRAHRVAFFLRWGVDPEDWLVCHECDNRPCCNWDHLFVGTFLDNCLDKFRKGRAASSAICTPGETNGQARLTEPQIISLRQAYAAENPKPTQRELSERYGISRGQIGKIINRKRWSHL